MVYLHLPYTDHAYDVATFERSRQLFFKRLPVDSLGWSPRERDTTSSKAYPKKRAHKVTSRML